MKVGAKTKAYPTPIEVEYPALDAADTATLEKNFGTEVVFNAAKSAIVISLQAFMRRHIEKSKGAIKQADLQAEASKWKPDVRSVVKMTAFEKVTSNIGKLTAEERKALLAELQKPAVAPAPQATPTAAATAGAKK